MENKNLRASRIRLAMIFFLLFLVFLASLVMLARSRKAPGQPNILFITIDTVRADHLSCYGYRKNTTPNIDWMARRGCRFRQAYSVTDRTEVSHYAMFFSLYVKDFFPTFYYTPPEHSHNLIECLKNLGYITAATVCTPSLNPDVFSPAQAFDAFYPAEMPYSVTGGSRKTASRVTEEALRWLSQNGNRSKWFFWAHYYDAHTPYWAPAPFHPTNKPYLPTEAFLLKSALYVAELLTCYDEAISYVDDSIGDLMKGIKDLGFGKNLMVVILSDHGEGFNEHSIVAEHTGVYEETVRIPLIFYYPEKIPRGARQELVMEIDVFPTILDLLGCEIPKGLKGKSLLSLLRRRKGEIHSEVFAESRSQQVAMVRKGRWKFVEYIDTMFDKRTESLLPEGAGHSASDAQFRMAADQSGGFVKFRGEAELYDLSSDPLERRNLFLYQNRWREMMSALLANFRTSGQMAKDSKTWPPPNEELLQRLKALGY